jgi:hypothetical protein
VGHDAVGGGAGGDRHGALGNTRSSELVCRT